jgi:exodeoxyribonuclease VII small subunit
VSDPEQSNDSTSSSDSQPSSSQPSNSQPSSAPDSYEEAVARLEQVIERLDSGEAGLRETLDLCREGRTLIAYCASELGDVDKGFEELRLEQLSAQLDFSEELS